MTSISSFLSYSLFASSSYQACQHTKHVLKLRISCLVTAAETSACCLQDADREAAQDATRDLWGRAEAISQAAPVVSAYDASRAHQQFAGAEALSRSACLFVVQSCMCWLQQDLRCCILCCWLQQDLSCSILCCWLQQDLRCSRILCCLEASL